MNTAALKQISMILSELVSWQTEREGVAMCVLAPKENRYISNEEYIPILEARIGVANAKLRALGFVATAHPGDTAKMMMS